MDKLDMKFSALNVDFDGPSLDFLGSKKPAHEGIKERYPIKVVSKWLEIDWQFDFVNRNCCRLSHVSSALAQISCILYYYTYIYMVGQNTWRFTFVYIFSYYWLIFKNFSLSHSADSLQ